ncbi:MAG TPA: hypothetical protein VEY69_09575 [Lautropia sp.]|nr:hypothetical protein [Lautropia sp.]
MAFDTAANIVNDAAVQLGLWTAAVNDPIVATDANSAQLTAYLKSLGQRLARAYSWSHLQKSYTFNTASSTETYPLPSDFARSVDQTHWNRTGTAQLFGPVGPQTWARLKNSSTAVYTDSSFRTFGNLLYVHPVPTAINTYAFEYVSSQWVQATADAAPSKEAPTLGTDVLWFDRDLLVTGLKLEFHKNKGFDTSGDVADFTQALDAAVGADSPGEVLSLSGPRGFPFLTWCNAPDGDWGF